jgi:hypothetical protein
MDLPPPPCQPRSSRQTRPAHSDIVCASDLADADADADADARVVQVYCFPQSTELPSPDLPYGRAGRNLNGLQLARLTRTTSPRTLNSKQICRFAFAMFLP